jgi:hypothetical protein
MFKSKIITYVRFFMGYNKFYLVKINNNNNNNNNNKNK